MILKTNGVKSLLIFDFHFQLFRFFTDLTALRAFCNRYCNNLKALDDILDGLYLGLLKLGQTGFKEAVTPVCQRLQNVLALYLPTVAGEETVKLFEDAQEFYGRIGYEPDTTLTLVAHLRFLENCHHELDELFLVVDYIHDLLLIIKDFNIPIDDERKEDYMDTEDYLNRTKETLAEIRERRQEFIDQLNIAMQDDINLLKDDIHEIAVEAMEEWLLTVCSTLFL